jgi:hypothetical protein
MAAYVGVSKWLQAFLISTTNAYQWSVSPPCGKGSQVPTGYNSSSNEMFYSKLCANPSIVRHSTYVPHANVSVYVRVLYRLLDAHSFNPQSSVSTAPSLRHDDRNLLTRCRISIDFRSGDRIPVDARFSTTVQTGPGVHPAFYTMGTGTFPRLKRQGRGVDHHPI